MFPATLTIKKPESIVSLNPSGSEPSVKSKRSIFHICLKPIQRFAVLWCYLILASRHWELTAIALAALSLSIIGVFRSLFFFLNDSDTWEQKLLADWIETALKTKAGVEAAKDSRVSAMSKIIAFHLVLGIAHLIASERWLKLLTRGSLVAIVLPYYVYQNILFSFAYEAIAKLEHLTWAWPDALITSIFMPITFSRIPSGKILEVLGGVHSILFILISYEIAMNGIRKKAERLQEVFKRIVEAEETKVVDVYLIEVRNSFNATPQASVKPQA
jgi:hypothetical protein